MLTGSLAHMLMLTRGLSPCALFPKILAAAQRFYYLCSILFKKAKANERNYNSRISDHIKYDYIHMKKVLSVMLTILAMTVLALAMTTACSSSDGMSVSKLTNSECLDMTCAADEDIYVPKPTFVLTRSGASISCELTDYQVNCHHGELYVDCQQDGHNIDIRIRELQYNGDGISTTCLCWQNIYFTMYDVSGDTFHVTLDGKDVGQVSFKESSSVVVEL